MDGLDRGIGSVVRRDLLSVLQYRVMGYIVLVVTLSLVAPILLVAASKDAARHVTVWALRVLSSTLVVSFISLAAQGDRGFLSNSQGVLTGCVFLFLSVGLGNVLAWLPIRCQARVYDPGEVGSST